MENPAHASPFLVPDVWPGVCAFSVMAMRIRAAECTECRLCYEVCPMGAVIVPGAGNATYAIDPERCTECVGHFSRPRCVAICPAGCVETDPVLLESREARVRKWHGLVVGQSFEAAEPNGIVAGETGESGA